MKRLLLFLFVLHFSNAGSQNISDSLWKNWQNPQLHDTLRLKSIKHLILDYYYNDYDSTILLSQQYYDLATRIGHKKHKAYALLTQGKAFYYKGENLKAIDRETKSIIISQGINDKKAMGHTLINLGNVFLEMGNYSDAVDSYSRSMKFAEEIGDKQLVGANLANIGIIFFSQGDYKKAMEYNSKNLRIMEELKDDYSLGYSYRNIGKIHEVNKEYEKAIYAYTKSYNFSERAKDDGGISYSLNYLGNVYHSMGQYDKALDYFTRSLQLAEKTDDTYSIAANLDDIGNCYWGLKDYPKAISYSKRSLDMADTTELVLLQRNALESLYKIYKSTGDSDKALAMFEAFSNIKDTILGEENRKGVLKKEIQYKYEKQSLADSLSYLQKQQLNQLEHDSQLDKEKNQRYILYGGLAFALIIGGIAFRGYQRKKRDNDIITSQKKEVEMQKDIVDEKQKEILDSISYAKRIQEAILPPARLLKKHFPESFVFYKPKDIVAGDFYWMETVENELLIAAADCTGHGVPGALVSVVCS
ncbi:MAG: tetratricopeptide repeat protein, partial [Bacteroidota bacterium]|nr:tetratricopeptide repeat protein [Bacteroidota bacterium]